MKLWPEEETVNVTWKYFDDDEELPKYVTEKEINMEINIVDDVKVNSVVDVEVNDKERWDDVDSDDDSNDDLMPELVRRNDKILSMILWMMNQYPH